MKKLLLVLFVTLAAMFSASAQYSAPEVFANNPDKVVPGLKYRQLKKLYNPKNYSYLAEPAYGTGRSWLNLLVPGLAQYTMGEPGRGTRYLLFGMLGEGMLYIAAHDYVYYSLDKEGRKAINMDDSFMDKGSQVVPLLFGSIILVTDYLCSIANANKIAKVKSQYKYDLDKLGRQVSFTTSPFLTPVQIGNDVRPVAGFTFAMQF